MSDDPEATARRGQATSAHRSPVGGAAESLPSAEDTHATGLRHDVALLEGLLADAARTGAGRHAVPDEDVAAALGLFENMRTALDRLEAQVVIEARRRGMEWQAIARHQGMKSSQAASQRYQRLVTRLEEIRQGIR
ncbi:hypothetical protein [Streptomyces sp. NPDC012825]|uniref:hypothetical protein n=1 Tax=Streptomyces sp. NPDC012825 TaxID=3364851 RepID=UPI003673B48F